MPLGRNGGRVLASAFVLVGGVVAALLAWSARDSGRGGSVSRPLDESAEEASLASGAQRAEPEGGVPEEPSSARTARSILEELRGPMTPEIEAALREEGVDLDAPFEVPPWETVEERFRAALGDLPPAKREQKVTALVDWPVEPTADALAQRYPIIASREIALTPSALGEIEDLVRERNLEIEVHARAYCDGLAGALQTEWSRERYRCTPVSTRVLPRVPRPAFHAASSASDGWAVKIQLFADDYPELKAELDRVASLRKEREHSVVHYLASLEK